MCKYTHICKSRGNYKADAKKQKTKYNSSNITGQSTNAMNKKTKKDSTI